MATTVKTLPVIEPANERVLAEVAQTDASGAEEAVGDGAGPSDDGRRVRGGCGHEGLS